MRTSSNRNGQPKSQKMNRWPRMDQHTRTKGLLPKGARDCVSTLSSILRALVRPASTMPWHISASRIAGNFLMGDFFGDVRCRYGHPIRGFNIGRGHFIACDDCRTYTMVGSNLMSSWRHETEDMWRQNSESVAGYRFIEWNDIPPAFPQRFAERRR